MQHDFKLQTRQGTASPYVAGCTCGWVSIESHPKDHAVNGRGRGANPALALARSDWTQHASEAS